MTNLVVSQNVYKTLLSLMNDYKDLNMPPLDYLRHHHQKLPSDAGECESCIEMFLSIAQQMPLLTDITNYFYCLGKRRDHSDQNSLIILCYILINILNESNKNIIAQILMEENSMKMIHLLQMFNKKFIEKDIFQVGCKYFAEDFIQNIFLRMKGNKQLLSELLAHMKQSTNGIPRALTKPVSPTFTNKFRPSPPCPTNTPQEFKQAPAKPVPKSTYNSPKAPPVLTFLKKLHHNESQNLIEAENKNAQELFLKREKHKCPSETKYKPKPPKKIITNNRPNITVKKNATTILREASRVVKEEEKEIEKLKALLSGATNYTKYEEWLEEVRVNEECCKLEDIERKHLQGLLNREEAILARQALLSKNKEKRALFDQERNEMEKVLKKMREKDNEKLKELIETTHNQRKNVIEKKKTLINERQKKAQEIAGLSRHLFEEAISKKNEELEKKIEIIKEIKTLSTIKAYQTEKFDPTETMNLGLMSEMSLAELQERLQISKLTLKEELEKRQNCIKKQRERQREFLIETEKFIEFCHQQKKFLDGCTKENVNTRINTRKTSTESPKIAELRKKLQSARNKRMAIKN